MKAISRLVHQLTRARETSVRAINPVPALTTPALAASHLMKLKLVQRGRFTGTDGEDLYHILPSAFLYAHMEPGEAIYLMLIEECSKLSHLIDKFGMEGLAAWLRTAAKVTIDDNMVTLVRYQRAMIYLKTYPDVQGKLIRTDHESEEKAAEPAVSTEWADNLRQSARAPSVQYLRYPGRMVEQAELDNISFQLGHWHSFVTLTDDRKAIHRADGHVVHYGDLHEVVKEVQHYRANMAGYEEMEAIFWLAARDIIFFGTWDNEVQDWTNGYSMAINVSDTFNYASADATMLKLRDAVPLKKVFQQFGFPGVQAWAAIERNVEVLPELQSNRYREARAYIEVEGFLSKPSE